MAFDKRAKRRPAVDEPPMRLPGQSLDEERNDFFDGKIMLWMLVAAAFVFLAFMDWYRYLFKEPLRPGTTTTLAVIAIALAAYKIWRNLPQYKQLSAGHKGEVIVGQALEELRAHGYQVFHDIPGDGFNVDHVLVGPGGVFAFETKYRNKPPRGSGPPEITYDGKSVLINGHKPDRDPIAQTRAGMAFIREVIERETGKRPFMRGAVLYPGWFVKGRSSGLEVWVLNPKNLPGFICHEDVHLSDAEVAEIARALKRHVTTRAEIEAARG